MKVNTPVFQFLIAIFLIAACARITWAAGVKHASKQEISAQKSQKAASSAANAGPLYATRPEAMQFADDLAARRNLDPAWVRDAIGQARYVATVSRLMQPATKPFVKNWRVYRSRFIDPIRIAAGVKFWQANLATLARAEKEPEADGTRERASARVESK